MGRIFTIVLFTAIGIGGGFLIGRWYANSNVVKPQSLGEDPVIRSILAEGKIQPADGFRMVTTLPGRQIEKILVKVGDQVRAGQTELCVMADEPLLKMQWQMTEAKKDDLGSEVEQKILAAELNRTTAEASLKEAKLNQMRLSSESPESSYVDKKIESSTKKLIRLKELAQSKKTSAFVSTQEIFDQELELEKARAEKQSLRQAAALAVETSEDALEIANQALANAKKAKKESRSLQLAEAIAKKQYDDGKVLAPADGEVVKIHAKTGNHVGNLPLMEIADLSRMIVEAEVYFANLAQVKAGQSVIISSPAIDQELTGKVIRKSRYIGNSLLQSANPLAMANQETAKVQIEIDSEFLEIAKAYLNLQVTVEIDTK